MKRSYIYSLVLFLFININVQAAWRNGYIITKDDEKIEGKIKIKYSLGYLKYDTHSIQKEITFKHKDGTQKQYVPSTLKEFSYNNRRFVSVMMPNPHVYIIDSSGDFFLELVMDGKLKMYYYYYETYSDNYDFEGNYSQSVSLNRAPALQLDSSDVWPARYNIECMGMIIPYLNEHRELYPYAKVYLLNYNQNTVKRLVKAFNTITAQEPEILNNRFFVPPPEDVDTDEALDYFKASLRFVDDFEILIFRDDNRCIFSSKSPEETQKFDPLKRKVKRSGRIKYKQHSGAYVYIIRYTLKADEEKTTYVYSNIFYLSYPE